MIYLSISLLLFFFTFWSFKGVNQSSQRLQFYNFVRLWEEAQDNKVIEKEPLTLEKDTEDESKYHLRYPKPPV